MVIKVDLLSRSFRRTTRVSKKSPNDSISSVNSTTNLANPEYHNENRLMTDMRKSGLLQQGPYAEMSVSFFN